MLTEVLAAPRDIQVPVGLGDIKAPDGRSAIPVPARPTKPIPLPADAGPEKVKMAASVPNDWKTEMLHEIEACARRELPFANRLRGTRELETLCAGPLGTPSQHAQPGPAVTLLE